MNAVAKPGQRPPDAQDEEPAKGGTEPAREEPYPSGDSPKPHGDAMQHAVDEAAGRKNTK
ncbi:MAG: hypothetical protein K2Z80_36530 [Xanthobacteraceae bacterium]|nr:hypothetical protein [Xanthobacteraceae bacterium]